MVAYEHGTINYKTWINAQSKKLEVVNNQITNMQIIK